MALNTIADLLADFKEGKPVILMDDEDRENEGDIMIAAELITPDWVNFMAKEARGLICLTLTPERCDFLGLQPMAAHNGTAHATPFTVSIEAAKGVTTGISAADRARTIQVAVAEDSKPSDLVQPGHIFPLRAQSGGVLSRAGHTEAGCDLARLAGLVPATVIAEIMNSDGSMARRPELERFAQDHGIKIGTVADLIQYRMATEQTVELLQRRALETDYGVFEFWQFRDSIHGHQHVALTLGALENEPVLVRVTSAELMRDLFRVSGLKLDSWSVPATLERLASEGRGALVVLNADVAEDFQNQVEAFFDRQVECSSKLAQVQVHRRSRAYLTIGTGSQILRCLGVKKMRLLSSPVQYKALSGFDLEVVEFVPFLDGAFDKGAVLCLDTVVAGGV